MNEILKKRIEEAELAFADREYEVGEIDHDALCKGFFHGAEYALSHQWISVEEAFPEYDEAVIVRNCNGEIFFCHRSNRIGVETDDDKWCNYTGAKIVLWMPTPELNLK